MLAEERRKKIMERLRSDNKVVVNELSALFNVSGETIRRDLDRLCRDGAVIKSYGGAVLSDGVDLPFQTRKRRNINEKRQIAALAETLIPDGGRIILDASTSAVFIAKELKRKKNLTVLTNSVEIMLELADMPGWEVISCGGQLRSGYLALTGSRAVEFFRSFNADAVVFSCKGIDIWRGVTDGLDDFAQIKKAMIASSRLKILAADSSKFGNAAFAHIADVNELNTVVTNAPPDENWRLFFDERGVNCLWPV